MGNKAGPLKPNGDSDKVGTNNDPSNFKIAWGFIKDYIFFFIGLIIPLTTLITALLTFHSKIFLTIFILFIIFIFGWAIRFLIVGRNRIPKDPFFRYFRIALLSLGIIGGIVFSFGIFKPNREFFVDSYMGTKTPTPTITFTDSPTPSITPTVMPSLTPSITPSITQIPYTPSITPSPSPTLILLFQDHFFDNNTGWQFSAFQNADLMVGNSLLKLSANCSSTVSTDPFYKCFSYFKLPVSGVKDFYFEFSLAIKDIPDGSIGILFRSDNQYHYYLLLIYPGTGEYELLWCDGNEHQIVPKTYSPYINNGYGDTNKFSLSVKGKFMDGEVNGQPFIHVEDANVKQEGTIKVGFLVPIGKRAVFELDYITITSVK
jgi:hypothetical protein